MPIKTVYVFTFCTMFQFIISNIYHFVIYHATEPKNTKNTFFFLCFKNKKLSLQKQYFLIMKTRLLSLLLTIMAASMTVNAYDFMKNGVCYNINSDSTTVTVTYQNSSSPRYTDLSGAITIPAQVTYGSKTYTVNRIGSTAFAGCTGLTSVTMPNTITVINGYAFSGCSGLTGELTIPNKVTDIGDYAFYGCSSLTQVTIPSSVKAIEYYAFNFCTNLKRVNITDLAAWCNIDFNGTASNPLQQDLYLNGTKVTNLVIPSSVTIIKKYAFHAFKSLQQVTIPSSVTEIGYEAFYYCTGLTSVVLPNTAILIGGEAFSACSSLATLSFPSSMFSIGSNAFAGTAWYNNQPDGVVYAGNVAYKYKGTMPQGTSITLKNGCLGIAGSAFYGCGNMTSITIPNTVKIISYEAFCDCSGLTSITIPNSVTSIGNSAFYHCNSLSSINFSNSSSLKEIGQLVFSRCCFTSITIPKSVTHIGLWAFDACNDLTQVNITDLTAWCNIDFEGSNSNPLAKANNLYVNGNKVTNLVIPNSVTTINNYAFNGCSMNSVTIPSTVTSIGDNAFRNCSQLSSVLIPNSVTSIGSSAFAGCSGMTSVTIPGSMTYIQGNAFSNCSSLSSVVTKIVTPENVNYANASSQFNGIPEVSTLYVPVGTTDKYQLDKYNGKTNPWLAFGEVQKLVDGDINLDGVVTSTDVTVIYNYLLDGNNEHVATCDVNGDGNITAADVTAIYNMLLGGN